MLKKIFELKGDEVSEHFRIVHDKKLNGLYRAVKSGRL
jgi:hypothetical protein